MIGFLLPTLFPTFDHWSIRVLRWSSVVFTIVPLTFLHSTFFFAGPLHHHSRLISGISLFCARRYTPPFGFTLVVDIVLVQFIFSLSWSHIPSAPLPLSLFDSFLIANSQIYLVRSGHALIRSSYPPLRLSSRLMAALNI